MAFLRGLCTVCYSAGKESPSVQSDQPVCLQCLGGILCNECSEELAPTITCVSAMCPCMRETVCAVVSLCGEHYDEIADPRYGIPRMVEPYKVWGLVLSGGKAVGYHDETKSYCNPSEMREDPDLVAFCEKEGIEIDEF